MECQCLAHVPGTASRLLHQSWVAFAGGLSPAAPVACLNRRMRNRTYGGVGGNRRKLIPYLMAVKELKAIREKQSKA